MRCGFLSKVGAWIWFCSSEDEEEESATAMYYGNTKNAIVGWLINLVFNCNNAGQVSEVSPICPVHISMCRISIGP